MGRVNQLLYLFLSTDAGVGLGFLPYLFRVATSFSAGAGAGVGTPFSSTMLRVVNFLPQSF